MKANGIRVPQDCETLEDAVELVSDERGKDAKYAETFNGKRFYSNNRRKTPGWIIWRLSPP